MSKTTLNLRHYGSSTYDIQLMHPICNSEFRNKPTGGLWTSPINSEFGWSDWTTRECYGSLSTYFDLTFYGTVCKVDGVADMATLPWLEDAKGNTSVSFEVLVQQGYDAIHLTKKGEGDTRFTDPRSFYGWDCETVLIFNARAVAEVKSDG